MTGTMAIMGFEPRNKPRRRIPRQRTSDDTEVTLDVLLAADEHYSAVAMVWT